MVKMPFSAWFVSDIDECSAPVNPCICNSALLPNCIPQCVNTVGSYECECNTGYVYDLATSECISKTQVLFIMYYE